MTTDPVLVCDGVSKRFGKTTALRSVTFSAQPGEFLTIFGHNGAGKSTLLNIIATLIRTYEGVVEVFGTNLKKADENTRRSMGFLAHDSFLYADLTAFENLLFYARLYGLENPGDLAGKMLTRTGLEEKSSTVVRDLSRGMKQRLSLGRAFLHEPRLLLLDEPYTGLDETACLNLNGMLSDFTRDGGSVLMTTHDIDRGYRVSDRVMIIDRGRIIFGEHTEKTSLESFRDRYHEILSG
jgi:heme ABC exporter ATP-binding subunit CcmA